MGEPANAFGHPHRGAISHGNSAGDADEVLGAIADLLEVPLGQLRNLAAVANLAGEQDLAVAVAQLDEALDKLDSFLDIKISPPGPATGSSDGAAPGGNTVWLMRSNRRCRAQ